MRAYNADKLCTDGAFGLCRHPVYASWTVLLLPGIALLIGSWILLTIPVVMAAILRWLVREEEEYLAERFGEVLARRETERSQAAASTACELASSRDLLQRIVDFFALS